MVTMCLEKAGFKPLGRVEWEHFSANNVVPPRVRSNSWPLRDPGDGDSDVLRFFEPLCRVVTRMRKLQLKASKDEGAVPGGGATKSPFIIGVAGSVAAGKSTFAQTLQSSLAQYQPELATEIVTTDGFLYPNAVLEARGLMERKGYPESYDTARFVKFLCAARCGMQDLIIPTYSHSAYDITGEFRYLRAPIDILILDGLNVLQMFEPTHVPSNRLSFSIYVDAAEEDIQRWYIQRFLSLQAAARTDPSSYFYRFRAMSALEATAFAAKVWTEINLPNLREKIRPTRAHADLIYRKDSSHALAAVWLKMRVRVLPYEL